MDLFYTSPRVLTDELYVRYRGWTGTSTALERESAYTIAEHLMERHLRSYLVPTVVTGTYRLGMDDVLILDYARILRVDAVTILRDPSDPNTAAYTRRTGFAREISFKKGAIHVYESTTQSSYCGTIGGAVLVEVVTLSGLSEGIASGTPPMLHALTLTAQECLQQIIQPSASEGGPGAPGVTSWSRGRASEVRPAMLRTVLGTTALSQFSARLVERYKVKRFRKLGQ